MRGFTLHYVIIDYIMFLDPGMDVCRYFEVDCDSEFEKCQLVYLNKWLPAPAQYKCSCKKGFKRHPQKKCIGKCRHICNCN